MILSAIAFALVLGAFVFLVLPRGLLWQRSASAALFVVLLAMIYGGSAELLGRPKPVRLEWRNTEEAKVVGASMREGRAIYLWLQVPGAEAPRAYELPWSTRAAEQLQKAMGDAQARGTGVKMSAPFGETSLDPREPKFYAVPQPAMPEKDYSAAAPVVAQ
ncbi:MAG: hypothetical protein IRY94_13375 [Rhodospirillaceae bacterium]|nr:hypothetical protein [Rhodospirillaceae bacterium]